MTNIRYTLSTMFCSCAPKHILGLMPHHQISNISVCHIIASIGLESSFSIYTEPTRLMSEAVSRSRGSNSLKMCLSVSAAVE
eukprot:m.123902 g.123902  ORF g.123902 m.123902 type:complete len:82 (-) comp13762_c0_seq7:3807-4052(-)